MLVLSMDAHPTGQLDMDVANADGTPVDLSEHEVVFWMDHPNVASVDGNGLVTAHKVPDGGFESPHLTGAVDMLSFGNLVDIEGFDYVESTEVRDEVLGLCSKLEPDNSMPALGQPLAEAELVHDGLQDVAHLDGPAPVVHDPELDAVSAKAHDLHGQCADVDPNV